MKHRILAILMVLISLTSTVQANATLTAAAHASEVPYPGGITTPAEMATFLDRAITEQMTANHIPGVVVTVVKDGKVFLTKGYGYANIASQTSVDPKRTLFRIGSTSKLFVWTAVMQLVEQGKLDLNTDVNTYLDFQIPATFPEPITMKHLLTHTPGFEETNVGTFVYRPEQLTSLGDYLKKHIPARVFVPGKVAAYSNYGAALAGYIVERISGMSFAQYAEKHLFGPLGMNHSTFRQPLPANLAPDMASGYSYIDGEYRQGEFELLPGYPMGSVSATADDMATFMIAHLQNGSYGDAHILSNATTRRMHSLLESYDPRFKDGMAYGFVSQHVNGQLNLWHNGGTLFFHTGLHLLPDQHLGFFISNNGRGSGMEATIFQAFMDHYFPFQSGSEPIPPSDMASRTALYTGEYYKSRSDFTGLEKIVNLLAPIEVSTDAQGYVFVGTKKYVEVQPGLLQSVENSNPISQLALTSDTNRQISLIANAPAVLIKALWYQTQAFHLSVLGISLLWLLITLIAWTISYINRLIKRQHRSQPLLARLARANGAVFIGLLLAFLAGFIAEFLNVEPISDTMWYLLEVPSLMSAVLVIPPVIAITGIALLAFMLLAWVQRFWSFRGRLHYTVVTLAAWAMLWELAYWNFLKF